MAEGGSDVQGQVITDQDLAELAGELGAEWERLGIFLGLNNSEVQKIKADHDHTDNRIYQMLLKWKQQAPTGTNLIGTLCEALQKVRRYDLAESLSYRPPKKREDGIFCPDHEKHLMNFYCQKCKALLCPECRTAEHRGHVVHNNAEVSSRCRTTMRQEIQRCSSGGRDMEEAVEVVDDAEQSFRKELENIIKQVGEEQTRTINEIKKQWKARSGCSRLKKELADLKERLSSVMEHAKMVLENKSDGKFLLDYPAAMSSMEELPTATKVKIDGLSSRPKFLPGKSSGDLGKVVMVDVWELCCTIGKKGSGHREFEGARGIAAAEPDVIAVTDRKNRRVVVFDSQGNRWQSISLIANDVTATRNYLIVLDPLAVKVYRRDDAQLIHEFPTVHPNEVGNTRVNLFGVAVKKTGNIIVGDCERKVLTELTQDGELLHTIPVAIKPYFLATAANDWIAISDKDRKKIHIVDVSDGNVAKKIVTIKPTIDGEQASCRGVCSDSSDIYLAASTEFYDSGHIHRYDMRGQFISCVAQNLYNPYGITFLADGKQLAVADFHSVKIYRKV
ncbi:E3 ubiquitin-protein ligase TRIM71-like [Acanthaster planci]|uniref:E3 ubiquitin-protein ligase TRIM71-like n=1 Tax=Acanthaster planci TaxID=133434 RepID=A0A8B7Y1E3_ACAPL|nr:E3 ubiquitin-protein ligase TRIM71-like [Acanthaster planci]XP_022086119.1 E3 ubiquitin-protein ligase TRIM71-like [Acanthaster planci]XP_022086120.1 E3 ubiquitin-protein ligase TRIM71-like [Acanthaster planci]